MQAHTTGNANVGTQGTSVQWGAWSGIGMVAANAAVLQRMERGGIQTVDPAMGLAVLSHILTHSSAPQVHVHLTHFHVASMHDELCPVTPARRRYPVAASPADD